jgi:hypothetical protein
MTTAPLEPDRDAIEIFVDALFRHASREGFASLRSFFEDQDRPFQITACAMSGGFSFLIDRAEEYARVAAQAAAPVVFCPPLAIFSNRDRARDQDVAEALALSVELDKHPQEARRTLETLLGPATVVVASGGTWINGGAAAEDKLHVHWRLRIPARGKDALAGLKEARALATRIAGGDASNVPPCHPIRWPGSWHRKAEPRLCTIETVQPDIEIDLDAALATLRTAAPGPRHKDAGNGADHDRADGGNEWPARYDAIISGRSFHEPLVRLAAMCVASGMSDAAAVNSLRGIMENCRDKRPEWQARYDGIPRYVRSAREKIEHPPKPPSVLGEWTAADDPGPIPPRQWLLGNQFCGGFISSLFAAGGVGKSALRLLQFLSMALGRPLCGQHVFRRCRVLLISLEDDRNELQRRIAAVLCHFGIDRRELTELFCATPIGAKLAEMRNRQRSAGDLEKQIRDAIDRRKPDLVALDPFIKLHDLAENDSGDMNFVCSLLTRIAVENQIAVDVPHHVHKGQIAAGDADAGRGSSGIRDAGRLIFTLTVMSTDEAQAFNIEPDQRYGYVRLDSAKVNITARSGATTWFRIVGVPIGNATAEYPAGDTIQVAEPWTPPNAWAGLSNDTLNAILDHIDAGIRDEEGHPTGERFSNAPRAKARAAWPVIQRFAPDKTEAQCRTIIHSWLDSGLLKPEDYYSPAERKEVKGLLVIAAKRPGTETQT